MGSCHSPEAEMPHTTSKVAALPRSKIQLEPTIVLIIPNLQENPEPYTSNSIF